MTLILFKIILASSESLKNGDIILRCDSVIVSTTLTLAVVGGAGSALSQYVGTNTSDINAFMFTMDPSDIWIIIWLPQNTYKCFMELFTLMCDTLNTRLCWYKSQTFTS